MEVFGAAVESCCFLVQTSTAERESSVLAVPHVVPKFVYFDHP